MKPLQQQNLLFTGQEYQLDIGIGRLNDDGKTLKPESTIAIPFDFISNLEITDDIIEVLPSIEIHIKDPFGEKLTDFPEDGKSILQFSCTFKQDQVTIEHTFVITSIKLLSIESQETSLIISGVSAYYPLLLGSLVYSSNGATGKQKSPTKIIEEILQQAELPVTKLEEKDHCSRVISFISPANAQVKSCINYLLMQSVTDEDGVFFLTFDMTTNKFKLVSLVGLAKKEILPFNGTKVPTHTGFGGKNYSGNEVAKNVTTESYLGSMGVLDLNAQTTLNEFSYLTRKWSKDLYTNTRLKRTLSPIKADDYQAVYLTEKESPLYKDKKVKMKYEIEPKCHTFLGGRLREFCRLNNNVRFRAKGYLKRGCGQSFKVFLDGPDSAIYKKLAGTYIISRLIHIFNKDNYEQEFDVVRPDRLTGLDVGVK